MTPLLDGQNVAIAGRLEPTDLRITVPAMVAVIGPNGGGKTSLLRALAGAERSGGGVRIDGEDLDSAPPARRPRLLTFLPASRGLVWPIAARDVIALGLPQPDPPRIAHLIETLELDALADRPVDRLSTGERARVLLARALAPRPRVLLLDEPLSNLDPYWVVRTLEILREAASGASAVLVALHDLGQLGAFDRALLVDRGRPIGDGKPHEITASAAFGEAFRVQRAGSGWQIRRPGDPRSSP